MLLALAVSGVAPAQEDNSSTFAFERLVDQVGGRQSTVYDIFEDPFGFIWFAGDTDGLLRFDGHELKSWTEGFQDTFTRTNVSTLRVAANGRLWAGSWGNGLQHWDHVRGEFVPILPDAQDPHSLASSRVQRLMIDASGRLWIGTTAGINFIDSENPGALTRFAHDQPDHPLHSERIWGMLEHTDGYWLATSSGVYHLSRELDQWRHFLLDESIALEFERGDEVRTIALVNGRIWAGSLFGVYVFDVEQARFLPVDFLDAPERPRPRINALLGSRGGGIWVGAHDGLYRIDDSIPALVRQGQSFNLIADVDIRTLFEDSEGNLWIGSRDQGIIHGQRRDYVFESLSQQATGMDRERLARLTTAVMHDAQGRLWLGVPHGLLRQELDGSWRHWEFDAASGVRRIERLRQAPDGRVWIATDSGLFYIDPEDGLAVDMRLFGLLDLPTLPINDLLITSDGSLWLALWHFGVIQWHPDSDRLDIGLEVLRDLRGDLVYQLFQSEDGELWASTRFSGLFRHRAGAWEPLSLQLNSQQHLASLYCVHRERDDRIWLCTEDGLLLVHLEQGLLRRYGMEDGLPADRTTSVWIDPEHGLWVLTPQGLAWRSADSDRFIVYGLSDGLPGLGMQRNAVDGAADGSLVLGTTRGAVRLDPNRALRGLHAPRTVLSRVWVDGIEQTRRIDPSQPRLNLSSDHRELSLQFAVLDFHDPQRNALRHQLHGFDEQFSRLSSDRLIRYTNLRPGEYLLEVQGLSSRGVPGEQSLLIPISVRAPWWHSPWAWIGAAVLLGSFLWAAIWLRVRALRVSNQRLQNQVAERTRDLEDANARLKASSSEDFLTGLLNRRGLSDQFKPVHQLAVRNRSALSLVLFDVDHFKRINDEHGHNFGDEVLKAIADLLRQTLRQQDLAARWGGEEFLLVLPGTDRAGAVAVCEKLLAAMSETGFALQGETLRLTASFGVVSGQGSDRSLEYWVKYADRALYQGKRAGRNCIIAVPDDLV
ncbi:MAG: diguanylate cyclase [Wenzhouxiangella sp.]